MKKKIFFILVLTIAAGAGGFLWMKRRLEASGAKANAGAGSVSVTTPTSSPTPNYSKTIGEFMVIDKEICTKDGKPSFYFFGSNSCPHCLWEKPIVEKVARQFGETIDFHENIDNQTDSDVFQEYSDINPGYVPFLVLGCKYARVGAGENLGKDEAESKKLEEEALTAILCKLTDGKPGSVCERVKEKTSNVQ